MTILGTRPELIKMSRVIPVLDACFNHILVHTGQNFDFELNEVFFQDLGIRRPDHFLEAARATAIDTIAEVIKRSDAVMEREAPEALLIYGDTNSGLACIPAKRRKIPIFHMEAGNRCFDARVPEEINRKIIDHTSDVNMVLTEHARRYLLAEGFPADRLFKIGSHMPEVLQHARASIERSKILAELGLDRGQFFIVSMHREENVDDADKLRVLVATLNQLIVEYNLPIVVSTHPRTRQRLEQLEQLTASGQVRYLPPFGFFDYLRLQSDAFAVVSDSGTIAEEGALLNLPAVTIRDSHERPEAQDSGSVVIASRMSTNAILDAVRLMRATYNPSTDDRSGWVPDYENGRVSTKVARIVSGYIDFVNRTVWHQD